MSATNGAAAAITRCPGCGKRSSENYDGNGSCWECRFDALDNAVQRSSDVGTNTSSAERRQLVIRASSVKSRSIRWAWTGYYPIGYPVVRTGVEGLGKSAFEAWTIARLTRGDLDGDWLGKPANVLVVASEDGIEDTWRPRLDLANADLDRVHFLNLDGLPAEWNLRDGIEQLAAAVDEASARVITIDAALDHMPPPKAGESINSPTFVRGALRPLRVLARERELLVSYSMHPPKTRSNEYRDLVQASQAFSAVPRIGLLLAYHPDDGPDDPERRRLFLRGKGNLGRDPGALEFRIVGHPYTHDDGVTTDREVVSGVQPSSVTLADLAPDRMAGNREPTKTERAEELIRDELADGGWHEAQPILDLLGAQGLGSKSVTSEARRRVGVETQKEGDGPWRWRLRQSCTDPTDGPLDSCSPARARPLTENGPFELTTRIPNNDGKSPTVHPVKPPDNGAQKSPSSDAVRAREMRASLIVDTDPARRLERERHYFDTGAELLAEMLDVDIVAVLSEPEDGGLALDELLPRQEAREAA